MNQGSTCFLSPTFYMKVSSIELVIILNRHICTIMVALGILIKSFFFLKIPNVVNWSDFEEAENINACTKTNKIFFFLTCSKTYCSCLICFRLCRGFSCILGRGRRSQRSSLRGCLLTIWPPLTRWTAAELAVQLGAERRPRGQEKKPFLKLELLFLSYFSHFSSYNVNISYMPKS